MTCEVAHQYAFLGKGETCLHGHDNDEWEETEDVNEAAAEARNVGLVEEGADQVAYGQDAQTVITEVEEKKEDIAVGKDTTILEHQCEDDDGKHKVGGTLQEPGKEVAEWVDAHHFHVLQHKSKKTNRFWKCKSVFINVWWQQR